MNYCSVHMLSTFVFGRNSFNTGSSVESNLIIRIWSLLLRANLCYRGRCIRLAARFSLNSSHCLTDTMSKHFFMVQALPEGEDPELVSRLYGCLKDNLKVQSRQGRYASTAPFNLTIARQQME